MATNHENAALSTLNLMEKLTLCNTWQKSGLSRSEFIRRNNLPKSFHYWCNKLLPKGLHSKLPSMLNAGIKTEHSLNHGETSKGSQELPDSNFWMQVIPTLNTNNTKAQNNSHTEMVEVKLTVNYVTLTLKLSHLQLMTLIKELGNADTAIR